MLPGGRFLSVFTFRVSSAPDPFSGRCFSGRSASRSPCICCLCRCTRWRSCPDCRRRSGVCAPGLAAGAAVGRVPAALISASAILVRFYSVTVYLDFCKYLRPTFFPVPIAMAMSVHILLRECSQLLSVQKIDVLQQNIRLYIRQSVV